MSLTPDNLVSPCRPSALPISLRRPSGRPSHHSPCLHLLQTGDDADTALSLAMCDLLLGDTDSALRLLEEDERAQQQLQQQAQGAAAGKRGKGRGAAAAAAAAEVAGG